jgi:CBS domain-containing protein
MTPGIHCCREDDDLAKAVQHMEMLEIRRLPVINKSKRASLVFVWEREQAGGKAQGLPECFLGFPRPQCR